MEKYIFEGNLFMRLGAVLLTLTALLECSAALAATLVDARILPAEDYTRLVLDLSAPAKHSLFTLEHPDRVVIDLKDTSLAASLAGRQLEGGPINKVRTGKRERNTLRVVLDLAMPLEARGFTLAPKGNRGHRVVVDLLAAGKTSAIKPSAGKPSAGKINRQAIYARKRDILVVIDPGHGGADPGALGPGGIREKDVVLAISRELHRLLDREQGFSAKLTRTSDYFIRLRQRNRIARDHNADLLVSIHADAFKRSRAHGASVFALSKSGATSETARWLAASENTADLIGGSGSVSLSDKDDVLAGVLLDLSMTASMKASLTAGDRVLRSMGKVTSLHKRRVEQAGFVVLKSPDIPSILVETGFISNPAEAQRLKTRKHQQKLARAIYRGLLEYFNDQPPPGTLIAWLKQQGFAKTRAAATDIAGTGSSAPDNTHVIRKGDTLSEIARSNNISTRLLKNYNQLSSDDLRIGQVLKIPTG